MKTHLALTALFIFALMVPTIFTTSKVSAYGMTAVPLATPEKPLTEEEVTALLDDLKGGLADLVNDEDQVTAINEKWDAHEDLAGETRKQVLALLFADVKSVVDDKEIQDAIWANWNKTGAPKEPAETEQPKPPVNPNPAIDIGQYIRSLSYNAESLLDIKATGGQPIFEKVNNRSENRQPRSGKITKCTRTTRTLSRNFGEIAILQPTRGAIYPGALIFADRALVDGGPRALTGLTRAPLSLIVDLPGAEDGGSFTVDAPSEGNVNNALNAALASWNGSSNYQDGHVDRSRSTHASTVAHSSSQYALSLGFNENWAEGPASAQFKTVSNSEKSVAAVVFTQVFYSVTVNAPENPAEFFDSGVNAEQARDVFSSTNVPAYIGSVSYGRIIMVRLETENATGTLDAEAALKYATGLTTASGGLKTKYDSILSNSQITAATFGAGGQVTAQNIEAANLANVVNGRTGVYSKTNPGVPISYTVNFLKDNSAARVGASTDYSAQDCQDFPNYWIEIRQNGVYVADYTVTWDEPGNPGKKEEGKYSAGNKMVVNFAGDASNIRINLRTISDFPIVNKELSPQDLNKCYQTRGIATGPTWDNNC